MVGNPGEHPHGLKLVHRLGILNGTVKHRQTMNSLLSGFSGETFWVRLRHSGNTMFVFNRSIAAVLLPLALLLAVALWSNSRQAAAEHVQDAAPLTASNSHAASQR